MTPSELHLFKIREDSYLKEDTCSETSSSFPKFEVGNCNIDFIIDVNNLRFK